MVDKIKDTMLAAEKLAIQIKKKAKRNDLDYSIQVSVSSVDPTVVYYAAQITPMAEGLAPQTFITKDPEDLLVKMKNALDNKISPEQIEKAYHESQISHAKRSIEFHEESIKALDEELKEEGDKE